MSGDAASYDISAAEISKDMEAERVNALQVEAIMKTAGDDKTWNAMEGFIGKDMSDKDLDAAIGAGQSDVMEGGQDKGLIGLIPKPKVVKPTDADAIEIAQFAVKKHNEKARTELVFTKLVGGIKWNVIAGTFYALMIETKDNKGTHRNKALVVKAITGHKKLIWYKN